MGLAQPAPMPDGEDLHASSGNSYYRFGKRYGAFYAATYDLTTAITGYGAAPRRLAKQLAQALQGKSSASILDFGCGTGRLTAALLKLNSSYAITGIEPNGDMLHQYRKKFGPSRVQAIQGGYENGGFTFGAPAFDAVAASGVFDHMPITEALIADFLPLCKRGGLLSFTYETHRSHEPWLEAPGAWRVFYSHSMPYVQQCALKAGGQILHHSQPRIGYFVNLNHSLHYVRFAAMILRHD